MAARQEVRVPDIGDFTDVEIIEVMVGEGDSVAAEDPLITLETDKAAMDVPAPQAGRVVSLSVSSGDRVSEGDLILVLETTGAGAGGGDSQPSGEDRAGGDGGTGKAGPAAGGADAAGAASADAGSGASGGGSGPAAGIVEVPVPDLGDFSDVEIIEVHVAAGEVLSAEDPLITLETDKAAMDVPAPQAGTVTELYVKVGDRVSRGDRVLALQAAGDAADAQPATPAAQGREPAQAGEGRGGAPASGGEAPAPVLPSASTVLPQIDEETFARAHASPSVRKLAREMGVDLGRVSGTGQKNRVTAADVKAFVKSVMSGAAAAGGGAALPAVPRVDFASFGEIEVQPLSRIQRISGPRLHASWVNLPHVTQHDEADITTTEEVRRSLKAALAERGVRVTPLAFLVKACVRALREFPQFNASLDESGDNLVLKKYYHIGFAADTPGGLVVPVIRDADTKDLAQIAAELGDLAGRARDGRLGAKDMQGGTFTISSLGGIGGTAFTPIINAPEVAILGASRNYWKPVYDGARFVPRLMLPLSLSYDHRVIDGAAAARFTGFLGEVLANGAALLLPEAS